MIIYLISREEMLEAEEKTVVTEVGGSINGSSKNRKQIDVTAVVRDCLTSHAKVLTQIQRPLTSTWDF